MKTVAVFVACAALLASSQASALDRQGSAHDGSSHASGRGFAVSGQLFFGLSPYNPTYAARPDNSGRALFRYALHLDVDILGPRLSIPIDLNTFTDRTRGGLKTLLPTEFDVITGLTSTWEIPGGALEVGARLEHDRPLDQGTFTQTYVDARARYLVSFADHFPSLRRRLRDGDISLATTLGWFAYNPTYAARPDNSGLALFRYAARAEVSFLGHFGAAVDATFFSDRDTHALRPSELDLTVDLSFSAGRFEVHAAYERDMPVDRGGLVQAFVYLLGSWKFDLVRASPPRPALGPPS